MLKNNFKIYIPSTFDVNGKVDKKKLSDIKKDITSEVAKTFGGFTSYKVDGGWLNEETGEIVEEGVEIIQVFTSRKLLKKNKSLIYNLCNKIKKELKQQAISLEIDNKLNFI
jgi:hypothetical protein